MNQYHNLHNFSVLLMNNVDDKKKGIREWIPLNILKMLWNLKDALVHKTYYRFSIAAMELSRSALT